MVKRVCSGGGFDPLHAGHIEHLKLAKALGDYLIVMVNPDEHMVKKKGYCMVPLKQRMETVKSLSFVDEVVINVDSDGTCAATLKKIRPDILAKGGDRTPENMPVNEIAVCKEIGCEIVYGVGGRLASSSEIGDTFAKRNSDKLVYFEPAGQVLSSHRSYFENPPNGYRFIVNDNNLGSKSHELLNTYLYKYGFGSLPWHIIKPKIESFITNPFRESILTFAWNHVIFRNEPWIVHVEWPEMLTGFSKFWFKRLRGLVTKQLASDNCKKIITWSEIAKTSFYNNYDYKYFENKIEVLPLAVSPVIYDRDYNRNKITFLFVCSTMRGREDYNFHMKGGKETIAAFNIISDKYRDVELIMISDIPKEYKNVCYSNCNIKIISDRVPHVEMRKYFEQADVFLFPGHDTPFGVILEAMSYGLPVIVTDVYGNKELVEHGITGFIISHSKYVKYFDGTLATRPLTGPKRISGGVLAIDWQVVDELVERMSCLIEQNELRKKMGEASRRSIENGQHSIRFRNNKLKVIFDEVTSK